MEATKWTEALWCQRAALGGSATMRARDAIKRRAGLEKANAGGRPAVNTGKAASDREASDTSTGRLRRGIGASTHGRGREQQHGKPCRWRARAKPESRKGQAGPGRVAERSVLPERPGNAGGGKGPQVRRGERKLEGHREWHCPRTPGLRSRGLEPPHAKAKGSECRNERKPDRRRRRQGVNRPARRVRREPGRGRGRATPATRTVSPDAPFPSELDPTRGRAAMIPLESPVLEIGTLGSVSGERKRG